MLHYWDKTLLNTLLKHLWIMGFSKLTGGNRHNSRPSVKSDDCSLEFLWMALPRFRVASLVHPLIITHLDACLGPFADLCLFPMRLPSVLCSALWAPVTWAFQDFQLYLLNPGHTKPCFHLSSLPHAMAFMLSLHGHLGLCTTRPVCLLSLRITVFCCLYRPFVVASGGKVDSVPITLSWPEARI